ncbi:FHA domain-containing protein, partial [bacterium]
LHLERGTATTSPAVNAPLPFTIPSVQSPSSSTVQATVPAPQQVPLPPLPTTPVPPPPAPKPVPMLRLTWDGGEAPISIEKGNYSLGRAADNDVVLGDSSISSHHARLELRGGRWILTDLGSTNGTFIGETRLQAHMPLPLSVGQDVRLER